MKRAVVCVENPQTIINQLPDYSLMVLNPNAAKNRNQYLVDNSDYSLLITDHSEKVRNGNDYPDERLFWYTSGTTGDSKFCSFSQQQLNIMVERVTRTYELTANDRYVNVMPLWHAHGQAWHWIAQHAKFQIDYLTVPTLRSIVNYSPTFISAIPHVIKVLAEFEFKDLRFLRSASASMPAELFTSLQHRYNVPVIEAFGMTETLSQCFTNPLNGPQKIGTVGLPDGIDARIVDGHLEVRGPTVCFDGWFDTGDLASVDEDGYYTILGRSLDRINVKGYKFDPLSLERQLSNTVTNLGDCVVFGQEQINCIYTGSVDAQQVKTALRKIHPSCNPATLLQLTEIPVAPNGKVSRTWLKEKFNCR